MPLTFRYLSCGCGLQSATLVAMICVGELKADAVFFADTQDEPPWVYETLGYWWLRCPVPFYVVTKGKLSDAMRLSTTTGARWAAIPVWAQRPDGSEAPLRRQCTREFKIEVIERAVRKLLGYEKGQRIREKAVCYTGISFDELERCTPSRTPWVTKEFPLVDRGMTRADCRVYLEQHGHPVPKKSSCVFCPYHRNSYWRDLKENYPAEFERACKIDELVRNLGEVGVEYPTFVHRSLVPLREAYFGEDQLELFEDRDCSSGYCGV